ncbi:MAG TPA: aminotransferase class I/II-fold pyridoxal phosphate-dependent enzyme [Gammaproteobacteria bacterium]|nr:aminotransferase class I/II-fold pyridoxal phosphate-dependent enzyme [Gammaproteobacteria bacterium]
MSRHAHEIETSAQLKHVRYEIRGNLARRALELERQGYEIISLNIGNPGLFGLRTPETMRLAMIENLAASEAYCNQKGIFPAREAVVMQQQERGVANVTADYVFMGNGVSELIDLTLRALLNTGDEVLIPSPDYPLWTAATVLNGGRAVYYPCPEEQQFNPDVATIEALISPRTRAIVIINPNNPTGAVYSRERLTALARLAERHNLVVMSDEIYDQMVYDDAEFVPMATLCRETLCATFSGLSKVYRACGYRVGWVAFSGAVDRSERYMTALDLLAALRLCSNVPGQWAVQTALGGFQSVRKLCAPGGRLYESRKAVVEGVARSRFLKLVPPRGAMYAFIGVDKQQLPGFDDEEFAMELLERQHVLVAPGSSFNTPYRDHFRITTLPDKSQLADVFQRIEEVLEHMAGRPPQLETA